MSEEVDNTKHYGRPSKLLTEQQIRQAMKFTKSNRAASRYLNVSYPTYRLYAKQYWDPIQKASLFEIHKNRTGKGIPKFQYQANEPILEKLLRRGISTESYSIEKLKNRLLHEGLLIPECGVCGFCETRVLDYKIPLILAFKDGNRHNWELENLHLLCYNHYFLHVGDIFSPRQINYLEDAGATIQQPNQTAWELDDFYEEHFRQLGLLSKEEDNPAAKFIDRL